jgi:hypothetical protein
MPGLDPGIHPKMKGRARAPAFYFAGIFKPSVRTLARLGPATDKTCQTALRMRGGIPGTRKAPEFSTTTLKEKRAQGMPGVWLHPQPRVQW